MLRVRLCGPGGATSANGDLRNSPGAPRITSTWEFLFAISAVPASKSPRWPVAATTWAIPMTKAWHYAEPVSKYRVWDWEVIHLELFNMTVKYDGKVGREQHGHPPVEESPL